MDITVSPSKPRATAIAATAALVGVLAAPALADAALPSTDSGQYCIQGLTSTPARTALGVACFFPSNGRLTVRDDARDGHGAHAQLVFGKGRATVGDPDGSKSRSGTKTVKVPKGQVPHLRLCITGVGCTSYKIPRDI